MLRIAAFIDAGYVWRQIWKALCLDVGTKDTQFDRSNIEINYSAFHKVPARKPLTSARGGIALDNIRHAVYYEAYA